MTVVLALRCADGLVLAADSQITDSARGLSYPSQKLHPFGDQGAWGGSGARAVLTEVKKVFDEKAPGILAGSDDGVAFTVQNEGRKIPESRIAGMFAPLARGADQPGESQNLGLGLYVCREIALAHGGSIEGKSDDRATSFTVRLPRHGSAVPPPP